MCGKEFRCLNTKGKYGTVTSTEIKWSIISKSVMIISFVEFIDQLIDSPINRVSLTCGNGQQAHWPLFSLQQVVPSGHSYWPPGHTTFPSCLAGDLTNQSTWVWPRIHFPWLTSQVVSLGQQWIWSLQHTACQCTKFNFQCVYFVRTYTLWSVHSMNAIAFTSALHPHILFAEYRSMNSMIFTSHPHKVAEKIIQCTQWLKHNDVYISPTGCLQDIIQWTHDCYSPPLPPSPPLASHNVRWTSLNEHNDFYIFPTGCSLKIIQ